MLSGVGIEAAELGELAHPRRADEAGVGNLAGRDGVDDLVVGGIPRHGRHLDADVGELGHEVLGEDIEVLALGAHRPDGDRAFGFALRRLRLFASGIIVVVAAATRRDRECERRH